MYRVKSTDVFWNLPGVVACYQPVSAPDPLAARQNVAHRGARFGVYTAVPGVLPTWSAATGWTFNGSTEYLKTGVIQTSTEWSVLVRFSGYSGSTAAPLLGGVIPAGPKRSFQISINGASANTLLFANGGTPYLETSPQLAFGVLGIAGKTAYRNGNNNGTIGAGTSASWLEIFLGAVNINGAATCGASIIQCAVFASCVLTSSEMWLASRQMAYCDINPDWSAWGRRRRYYYAPSAAAAAFNPAWAQRTNTLLGGGFD